MIHAKIIVSISCIELVSVQCLDSLCSLENLDRIFEFANHENPIIHAKNFSISCMELKFLQFWLIFAKFCRHGNSFGFLENLDSIFEFADPETLLCMGKISRFVAHN